MILVIDNYDSFTYNLYQVLANAYEAKNISVFRNDAISIADIKKLNPAGIIISPGPGRPEDAGICIELIQADLNIPIFGVCLGLQAIVSAFGGKVIPAPEIFHGKTDLIFHHRRGLYEKMPLPFEAGRYHSLMADPHHLPSCLSIEAENPNGLIMGLRHREKPIYGVQFHPESILTPMGSHLIENFLMECHQPPLRALAC